jgi:hypothetical protein
MIRVPAAGDLHPLRRCYISLCDSAVKYLVLKKNIFDIVVRNSVCRSDCVTDT